MSQDSTNIERKALRLLLEADSVIAYAIERREEEGIGLDDDWRAEVDHDIERWTDLLARIRALLKEAEFRVSTQ